MAAPSAGFDIRVKYAQALLITQGYTAPATQAAFDRANETSAAEIGDPEHAAVRSGRWHKHFVSGELRAALELGEVLAARGGSGQSTEDRRYSAPGDQLN